MSDPVSSTGPIITSPIVVGGAAPEVTSPIVEGNPPAPVETPPAADPAALPVDPAAPVDESIAPKTTPKWAQDRINELTAKRHAAERQTETERSARIAAETRAQELLSQIGKPATDPTAPATPPAMTETEIDRRATEKAQLIAQANEFNKACNAVVNTGKKEFTNWDEAVKNLGLVGAIGKDVDPGFLETAIELENPAAILHHLGTNLEEAERLVKMPPKKMAMEMARIEAKLKAPIPAPPPAALSQAPAPVITVGGAAKPGAPEIHDPTISMDDFNALRNKQIEDRRNRYKRV